VIPEEYIAQKFFQFNGGVKFHKHQKVYQGSCFICKEGSSWLKKKRCYFIPKKNAVCCHNCGWYSSAVDWVIEVTGLSFREIANEARSFDFLPPSFYEQEKIKKEVKTHRLPADSINLFDKTQLEYYRHNKVVRDAIILIVKRRLHLAVNRPKTLWVSLSDKVHSNRLIIPFYDSKGDIIFYQSRAIYKDDNSNKPKYLGKMNGEKTLYGVDSVNESCDTLFIFEGPINSFFCKNGIAVGGIQENSYCTFTTTQQSQIQQLPLFKKVWVLDSQWLDEPSLKNTEKLIEIGETVFIWPVDYGRKYKDFNDITIELKTDQVEPEFITSNSFSGLLAKTKLLQIKNSKK
jgi:hypothetical protein